MLAPHVLEAGTDTYDSTHGFRLRDHPPTLAAPVRLGSSFDAPRQRTPARSTIAGGGPTPGPLSPGLRTRRSSRYGPRLDERRSTYTATRGNPERGRWLDV